MRLIEITSANQPISQDAYEVFLNTIGRRYKKYCTDFQINVQLSYNSNWSFPKYAKMTALLKEKVGEMHIMLDYDIEDVQWEVRTEVISFSGSVAPPELIYEDLKTSTFAHPREVIEYLDYLMTFCESSLS